MLKLTKFLGIPIGHLFWAHGITWSRTSHDAATPVTGHSSSCNFVTDAQDEYVLAIDGTKLEDLVRPFLTQI